MKILIVEDEKLVAISLQRLLLSMGYVVEDIAGSYEEAVEILESKEIHLAFFDIDLKGKQTGIDLANYVRKNIGIPYIYLTAVNETTTLNDALETAPHAFLFKPFRRLMIYTAVNMAIRSYREEVLPGTVEKRNKPIVINEVLFVKEKESYVKIALNDIRFITSDDNYVELHTEKRKFVIRETLKSLMEQLPANTFFRIHKSYIINLNAVQEISQFYAVIGDVRVPISDRYRHALLSRLHLYS